MLERRVGAIVAAICAALAIVAFVFDWSFVVGKRGIEIADGAVAHLIGAFWLVLALFALASGIADPVRRRQANTGLTIVLVLVLVGPLVYMYLNRP